MFTVLFPIVVPWLTSIFRGTALPLTPGAKRQLLFTAALSSGADLLIFLVLVYSLRKARFLTKEMIEYVRREDSGIELWGERKRPTNEKAIVARLADETSAESPSVRTLVIVGTPPELPETEVRDYRHEPQIGRAYRDVTPLLFCAFGIVTGSIVAVVLPSLGKNLFSFLFILRGIMLPFALIPIAIAAIYLVLYGRVLLRIMPGRIQVVRWRLWRSELTIRDFEITLESLLIVRFVWPSHRMQLTLIRRGHQGSGSRESVTLRKRELGDLYCCFFSSFVTPAGRVARTALVG